MCVENASDFALHTLATRLSPSHSRRKREICEYVQMCLQQREFYVNFFCVCFDSFFSCALFLAGCRHRHKLCTFLSRYSTFSLSLTLSNFSVFSFVYCSLSRWYFFASHQRKTIVLRKGKSTENLHSMLDKKRLIILHLCYMYWCSPYTDRRKNQIKQTKLALMKQRNACVDGKIEFIVQCFIKIIIE